MLVPSNTSSNPHSLSESIEYCREAAYIKDRYENGGEK